MKRLLLTLALLLAPCAQPWLAPPALAQVGPDRTLTGTVTDGHEPLKGAVVELENETTSAVTSYVSTADGHYRFLRLDSNTDYRVWATYRGHKSKVLEISKFNSQLKLVLALPIRLE